MNIPLNINFDPPSDRTAKVRDGVVRLPMIYQRAPYSQLLRVKAEGSEVYRDFADFDDIIMTMSAQQGTEPFLRLSKQSGTIKAEDNGLRIVFPASTTKGIPIPVHNVQALNTLRFLHTIDLVKGNEVVERFAQGYGFIVAALKEPA